MVDDYLLRSCCYEKLGGRVVQEFWDFCENFLGFVENRSNLGILLNTDRSALKADRTADRSDSTSDRTLGRSIGWSTDRTIDRSGDRSVNAAF